MSNLTSWVKCDGARVDHTCLMTLVACGEITGITKPVVAVYFQRLYRSSPGGAEKNNQKPVNTIGVLDGYLPFADQEEGYRFLRWHRLDW
jgi:hypothetical protein